MKLLNFKYLKDRDKEFESNTSRPHYKYEYIHEKSKKDNFYEKIPSYEKLNTDFILKKYTKYKSTIKEMKKEFRDDNLNDY